MIEFRDIHLQYGKREVLKGISMLIPDGQITAVLGPSGSGKSTILKIALGLVKPTRGRALVDGIDITDLPEERLFPIRRKMGMVFQGNALFDSLNIAENMGFFLRENLNLPEGEIQERVRRELKFAGLEGYEHQLPGSL
ncbi:ATP-binding cassette domain-containing protein, partial [bacterium]